MNKTYNVNLGGMPFQINDDAFNKLSAYLNAVKLKFANEFSSSEIVEDIEARIAELFYDNLKNKNRKIVSLKDVNAAIDLMGTPEQFEFDGFSSSTNNQSSNFKVGKRLYRDPDDKWLGGVIAGICHFIGIENPTYLRIALLILPLIDWLGLYISTGLVFLSYIVLWIVVPNAVTQTEKMQMRGEPINLDNIEKSFNDSFDKVKKNLNSVPTQKRGRDVLDNVGTVLLELIKILLKLVVIFFLISLGIGFLGILFMLFTGAFGFTALLPYVNAHLYSENWMSISTIIGLLLLFIPPVIFILIFLSKLIFKTQTRMPAVALSTLGACILGIVLTTIPTMKTIQDFSTKSTISDSNPINHEGVLQLSEVNKDEKTKLYLFNKELELERDVDLIVQHSKDSTTSVTTRKMARGKNIDVAKNRAEDIQYNINYTDNELKLNKVLGIPDGLYRSQKVDVIVEVPNETILEIDKNLSSIADSYQLRKQIKEATTEFARFKMVEGSLIPIDENGNRLLEESTDDEINIKNWEELEEELEDELEQLNIKIDDLDIDKNELDINLFGNEILKLEVVERDANGDVVRVNLKIGDKEFLNVEMNE